MSQKRGRRLPSRPGVQPFSMGVEGRPPARKGGYRETEFGIQRIHALKTVRNADKRQYFGAAMTAWAKSSGFVNFLKKATPRLHAPHHSTTTSE